MWYENKGVDVCGTDELLSTSRHKLLDKRHTKLVELGVSLHRGPIHPQQATIAARLRSFVSWPSSVKKEDLADAGFFYIGISDHTKCFYCDGCLCSWEPEDDPWEEHARWFRNCNFVYLNKGEDFIKACTVKNEILTESESGDESSRNGASSDGVLLKEAMQSSMITAVLETGVFPPHLVRAAIIRQIQESGSSFKNLDEICEAVQFLQMTDYQKDVADLSPEDLRIEIQIPPSEESNNTQASSITAKRKVECTEISNGTDQNKHSNKSLNDQRLCKICMDKEAEVVFLPCRHMLACTLCTSALKNCPLCCEVIQATVTAYIP